VEGGIEDKSLMVTKKLEDEKGVKVGGSNHNPN
jgi:hypothetical protein